MKITDTPSIERLKELLAKATPLPWFPSEDLNPLGGCLSRAVMAKDTFIAEVLHDDELDVMASANAELIVAVINALPHLIATLETLTPSAGEVERIEDAVREIDDAYSAADQEPCRCNVDELSCPHCNAWDRARKRTHEILAGLTASPSKQPLFTAGERHDDESARAFYNSVKERSPEGQYVRARIWPDGDWDVLDRAAPPPPQPDIEGVDDLVRELRVHADDLPRCIQRDYMRLAADKLAALSLPTTEIRREALLNGCNALLGLVQLILARDDLPASLREALLNSHRVAEAREAVRLVTQKDTEQ